MRAGEQIRFVIDIEVHDPDRFREIVARCVEVSREEPGTLVYDWYLSEDGTRARLYEAYADREALDAHTTGPVFTDVGVPLLEVATFVHVDAFGDLGDPGEAGTLWPTTFWGTPFSALHG